MSAISIVRAGGMVAAIGGLSATAGHAVEVMSRDAAKTRVLAEEIGAGATRGTFGAATAGDIVILWPPVGRVHRPGRRAGEGTRLGVIESLGLRPVDTGPLPMARTLKHTCMLSLGLLTHSVKHTNFSIGVSLLG